MNNLAHSICQSLAGTSCSVAAHETKHPYMGLLQMCASPSILVDAPHFFLSHTDIPDFDIAYFGQDEYKGMTGADARQVSTLSELQYELDEMKDGTKPRLVIADLAHLGLDRPVALNMIADYLEDGDMWDEQVLVSVEASMTWAPATTAQTFGRIRRERTAEVHVHYSEPIAE
ncbi:hypothetical protein pEaSNUABM40_00218 [Erwinia phage pEa_SNUABM_40]|nr:hypothetical protein pEaSNUABM40_00218 [Erwinia phage pEa_SNUABM_40]UAW52996.1 hypothetical protein pEaSNUABM23_00214 [Erwinia phage pEa_SNUABM_23]UIW10892.1 hypothetical protein pEaSNUABM23_00214 [Erwinia phage pEa_SNUABM_31]